MYRQNFRRDNRPYIRRVEFAFYNELEIREAVALARADIKYPELRNGSYISDPTASAAMRNLTPIKAVKVGDINLFHPESWLEVIDKTYNWCARRGQEILNAARSRYRGVHFAKICATNNFGVDKFYDIIEQVRNYAALQAAQLHLIYID